MGFEEGRGQRGALECSTWVGVRCLPCPIGDECTAEQPSPGASCVLYRTLIHEQPDPQSQPTIDGATNEHTNTRTHAQARTCVVAHDPRVVRSVHLSSGGGVVECHPHPRPSTLRRFAALSRVRWDSHRLRVGVASVVGVVCVMLSRPRNVESTRGAYERVWSVAASWIRIGNRLTSSWKLCCRE